ncbi:hypothetical protein D3C72_634510 [compost metagenome]
MVFKLRRVAGLNTVVARIMRSRCYFINQYGIVFCLEHFNCKQAYMSKGFRNLQGNGSCLCSYLFVNARRTDNIFYLIGFWMKFHLYHRIRLDVAFRIADYDYGQFILKRHHVFGNAFHVGKIRQIRDRSCDFHSVAIITEFGTFPYKRKGNSSIFYSRF